MASLDPFRTTTPGTACGNYHDSGDLFVEIGDPGSRIFGSVVSDDVLVNRLGIALV
jgi:hypothetical protein